MLVTIHSIIITPLTTTGTLTVYVDRLKRVYQNPPPTRLPFPNNCNHIKLAMTKEKGIRHRQPDAQIELRVKGKIEQLMDSKVPVDMDSIFVDGTFENARRPMVILVEGALGSGKTSLAYHYCQKWAEGNLSMFDIVALVYLRHPAVHSAGLDLTLHQLLLLACVSDGEREIEDVIEKVVQCVKGDTKTRLLVILDGWDEAPACLRNPRDPKCPPDNSYLGKLVRSVSSNTTILITSRPDFSLDLHTRANVNRVEILGFTKESIHDYFQEALSTQLSSDEVKVRCKKLRDHFLKYPAIESSCYVPLNAAILVYVYVTSNCSLPTTDFELLKSLVFWIVRHELEKTGENLLLFDDLDGYSNFKCICKIACDGIEKEKIVFTEEEISENLPTMGVLQAMDCVMLFKNSLMYNFIHLSVQEFLAVHYILKLTDRKQLALFRKLLGNPCFNANVLRFYAGFTKLDIRKLITDVFAEAPKLTLRSCIQCIYAAHDQFSDVKQIIAQMNNELCLSSVTLSALSCIAVGYFLALVFKNDSSVNLRVDLGNCRINGDSIVFMIKELSKHNALRGMNKLILRGNNIGDTGIKCLATALKKNTTLVALNIGWCGISASGVESLARCRVLNHIHDELNVSGNNIGDCGIACIVTALHMRILDISECSISDDGAKSLATALTGNSELEVLRLMYNEIRDEGIGLIAAALKKNQTLENF